MCPKTPASSPLICHDAVQQPPLEALSRALESVRERDHWSSSTLNRVNLVLEEILQNIFEHGEQAGQVSVWVSSHTDSIELLIQAPGQAFDPRAGATPDLDESLETRMPGGVGLHLVRELCSSIDTLQLASAHQLVLRLNRD
ncbi:MAG: hypothetical protein RI906_150 [Pseudomonadota bacterium]